MLFRSVEIDPYCQKILARHWPDVPRHDDVNTAPHWWRSQPRPRVDVVCGGFPCQPFSLAGKQEGIDDDRWMWPQTALVIRATRPRYVLLENVSALVRDRWAFGAVLADLHSLGFDAEWTTVRASDHGAPHSRERVYIVAHTQGIDGGHGIAWSRAESGKHRSQLEDYLAWQHISAGGKRVRGWKPNPEWTDWLMGFPPRWTDCDAQETPSSHRSPITLAD